MVSVRCLVVTVLLGLARASELKLEAGVTPIAKVQTLLQGMLAKGRAAKQDEEIKFSAFATWCTNIRRTKAVEVQQGSDLMLRQEAKIQKATASIKGATSRAQELEEDVGRWQKDKKSASTVRAMEKTDYTSTAADYSESIDAIAGAITTLKKQDVDRPQTALLEQALLQVQSQKLVPSHAKRALAAFLQQANSDDSLMPAAPEANAYENQSGGVIEMLEKLQTEFADKKSQLDSEEMNAQHAFEAIMQQLADNIENASHEVSKKKDIAAEQQQLKAETEGDLAATTGERNEDKVNLGDADTLCKTKSQDYEQRQELRAAEITAISKAIEIIGSAAVAGSGDKHLPALLQIRQRAASLVSFRSSQQSPIQDRIAAFLAERAKSTNSKLLALVSQRVAADPFGKVKKMVKDLIVKLMEEGTAETEHKGWCDTEITTNKQTRDVKSTEISKLSAQAEDLGANIASLTEDIKTLTAEVAELDAAMAKQSAERSESKATNTATVEDAKGGQLAVTQAISVLKEFYAKSADATALTQEAVAQPATFDGAYTGMGTSGGGVIDFLEVILSDFARLEAETTNAEGTEQEDYEKFMQESKMDKALKENMASHKEATKTDKESALHTTSNDLKVTQEQLDKAMAYYEKLKPTCVDSGITYEERVKRREEEIVSLQEALKILAGDDIA